MPWPPGSKRISFLLVFHHLLFEFSEKPLEYNLTYIHQKQGCSAVLKFVAVDEYKRQKRIGLTRLN
jgi:hypothetical protein